MLPGIWSQVVDLSLVVVLLRLMTPILLSALGGLISDIGGVMNIGLEGLMLLSAFTSIAVCSATGSWAYGAAAGVAVSVITCYLMGFFSIRMKVDIIVAGFAVNIFGSGVTIFLMSKLFGVTGNYSPSGLQGIPHLDIPGVRDIPLIGAALTGHNLMVWVALASVLFCVFLIYRTTYGVHLRAAGEAPEAAKSLGLRVDRLKYSALAWSGVFAGLAGAYLSIGKTGMFVKDMTAGTGFLALAVVLLGNRHPVGVLVGSFVFGLASALATVAQTTPGSAVPSQFIQGIPYAVTLAALVVFAVRQKRRAPSKYV